MEKVLANMKAKPSIRAGKDWDLTEKVSREGSTIIKEMIEKEEITEVQGRRLNPNDCRAPRITGCPKIHKPEVPLRHSSKLVLKNHVLFHKNAIWQSKDYD